jgi:hypothetical protein
MISAVVGVLVLQASLPADPAAAPPILPPPVAAAAAKALKPKDASQKRVCRNETTVGSLIPKRICLTQEDWDAMEAAGKQITRGIQDGAQQRPPRDMSISGG